MSEGLELRRYASFAAVDRQQETMHQKHRNISERCKGCKVVERHCKEIQENCERRCKEIKEHCDRENKEVRNMIKELLKRNHNRRYDLFERFEIEEGSSSFVTPQKIATSSADSMEGPGKDNEGLASTTESVVNSRSNHLVDLSLGKIMEYISIQTYTFWLAP